MYDGLLLSKDGGIITDIKKSAQQGEPTIIIGLGGTGVDALKVVKKKVYEQLIPDNTDGDIPEYKRIGFLAVDTDYIDTDYGEPYDLERKECFYISVDNLNRKMKDDIASGNKEFAWLQPDIKLLGERGAGAVRQAGRYCLFKNIDNITEIIRVLKTDVTAGAGDSKVNVHIIAGISGGTGGGTFIDMCYIIRELLGSDATLFGYFFMPDVNLNKWGIGGQPLIANRIKNNGYAALKELDYTMNLSKSGDSFSQYYGGSQNYLLKETTESPVDLCHLISSTDKKGCMVTNGYMYSLNTVGEYILSYLAEASGYVGTTLTSAAHLAKVNALTRTIKKKHGENLNYHILGASVAESPTREIGTYLAAKLYKKLEKGLVGNEPNDSDVGQHADAMGLKLDIFRKELYGEGDYKIYNAGAIQWEGANDFSIDDVLNTQIITDGEVNDTNIAITDIILRPARFWREKNIGKLEENFKKLTRDLDNFDVIGGGANATTLISNVFEYLQNNIMMAFGYGAVYASRLTHNDQGFSLNDRLSEIIREAAEAKANCELDREARVRDIIEAVKFCRKKGTGIFATKKKQQEGIDRYRNSIRAYYQNVFDIEVYQKVIEMADILKNQIDKDGYPNSLYPNYFKPLEKMLIELKATFEENSRFFNEPATNNDEFVLKIVGFKEVQERVDHGFENIVGNGVSGAYRSFVSMLMDQYDKWAYGDRYKVEKMITLYISNIFTPVLSTSMESYLNGKMALPLVVFQHEIANSLKGVLGKVEPKFYIDDIYVVDAVKKYDLNVPAAEPNICAAAQSIAVTQPINVRYTGIGDRISVVKFESGIPLYAYGLTDVLEREYESGGNMAIGRHLYEITDRNKDIDWASLPSVIPYSIRPQSTPNGEEIVNLYKEAESVEIIAVNPRNSYDYCVYELEMPQLKDRYDFADGNEFQEYIKMLNRYRDDKGKVSPDAPMHKVHSLCNDGYVDCSTGSDYRETCRIDYFIQFKNLQAAARNSIAVLDSVDKAIEEANNWIEEAKTISANN